MIDEFVRSFGTTIDESSPLARWIDNVQRVSRSERLVGHQSVTGDPERTEALFDVYGARLLAWSTRLPGECASDVAIDASLIRDELPTSDHKELLATKQLPLKDGGAALVIPIAGAATSWEMATAVAPVIHGAAREAFRKEYELTNGWSCGAAIVDPPIHQVSIVSRPPTSPQRCRTNA